MAWPDETKAQALVLLKDNDGNCSLVSLVLGIPLRTVQAWAAGQWIPAHVQDLAENKKACLADGYMEAAIKLLGVASGKASDCSGPQAMTMSAIALDKALLLKGEATEITDSRHTLTTDWQTRLGRLTPEERDEFERLLGRMEAVQPSPDEKIKALSDCAYSDSVQNAQVDTIPVVTEIE